MAINPIGDKSEAFSAVLTVSLGSWGEGSAGSGTAGGSGSTGASGFAHISVGKSPLSNVPPFSLALFWSLGSAASGAVTVYSGTVGVGSVSVMESSGPSSARGATIVTVPSKMAITV